MSGKCVYHMDMSQCQNCTSDEKIEVKFKNDINMGYYGILS